MKKFISFSTFIIFLFSAFPPAFAAQNPKIGFMVIAQDRGFVGNNETVNLFNQFEREYLSSLVFVGRKYDGMKSEYSEYIQKGISEPFCTESKEMCWSKNRRAHFRISS